MSLQEVFGEEELITQYINGSYENEQLNNTISIGLSGEIIAISEPSNVQNGIERHLVRVYQKQRDLLGQVHGINMEIQFIWIIILQI